MSRYRAESDVHALVTLAWYNEYNAWEVWRKEIKPIRKYAEKDKRLYEIIKERREKLELPPL